MSFDFDTALAASFSAFGDPATYGNAAASETAEITVVAQRPDVQGDYGESAVVTATRIFDVMVSDLSAPETGGTIVWKGVTHRIQGVPFHPDVEARVWRIEAWPV